MGMLFRWLYKCRSNGKLTASCRRIISFLNSNRTSSSGPDLAGLQEASAKKGWILLFPHIQATLEAHFPLLRLFPNIFLVQELGMWETSKANTAVKQRGARTALALRLLFQGQTEAAFLGLQLSIFWFFWIFSLPRAVKLIQDELASLPRPFKMRYLAILLALSLIPPLWLSEAVARYAGRPASSKCQARVPRKSVK